MAYSIITTDKQYDIEYSSVNNLHIGTLYGGLKNSLGLITGNLPSNNLGNLTTTNSEGWCTITLDPVGDNTAVKVLISCSENTGISNRQTQIKLKYGNKESKTLTILQKIKNGGSTEEKPSFSSKFYFQFSSLLSLNYIPRAYLCNTEAIMNTDYSEDGFEASHNNPINPDEVYCIEFNDNNTIKSLPNILMTYGLWTNSYPEINVTTESDIRRDFLYINTWKFYNVNNPGSIIIQSVYMLNQIPEPLTNKKTSLDNPFDWGFHSTYDMSQYNSLNFN